MNHKQLLSLIGGLVMITIPVFASFQGYDKDVTDGHTIVLVPLPDIAVGTPRSTVPFFAEYIDAMNTVQLGCNDASVGNVTVTLSSTAGDWYQTVFDTSDGPILIPASGNSGHYTLTLVTTAGDTYIGEFEL